MTLYLTTHAGKSRTTLQQILVRHTGHTDFRCGTAPGGKPYAVSDSFSTPLYFSLSHSGAYLALLIHEYPVGIDLQLHVPLRTEKLAKRWFHPAEYTVWTSGFSDADRFFSLWTAKEAYGKYLGCGLSPIYRSISVLSVPEVLCLLPCLPGYTLCFCTTVPAPVTVVVDPSVSGYIAAEPVSLCDAITKR